MPAEVELSNGDTVFVRVVEVEQPSIQGEDLGCQQFLAIGDNIFYALEGARQLDNGVLGNTGDERHFLLQRDAEVLRSAEPVAYVDPQNNVPFEFYAHRVESGDLDFSWRLRDDEVTLPNGPASGTQFHADRQAQTIFGTSGNDVIDGVSRNKVIHGVDGDNLIAGGIDNDLIYGGVGDDIIWGGDGRDEIHGTGGNNLLLGGRGDDVLIGGSGDDILVGGRDNDVLTGGGGVNRFHFAGGDGANVITDFDVSVDALTFQDDVDPEGVHFWSDEGTGDVMGGWGDGHTVHLEGVSMESFVEAALIRQAGDEPMVSIALDPQVEALHALRLENDLYEGDVPDLEREGVVYGSAAFTASGGAAGLNITQGPEFEDDEDDDEDHDDDGGGSGGDDGGGSGGGGDDENRDDDEGSDGGSCFVASAAYGDPSHSDVVALRRFRDEWLVHRAWGRDCVALYWRVGPVLARVVSSQDVTGRVSRGVLSFVVRVLNRFGV